MLTTRFTSLLASALCLASRSVLASKPVFAHYMVGGITDADAATDIQGALDLGIDAFALNVGSWTESWSLDAISTLFNAASGTDMKLFFSFDTYQTTDPSQWVSGLQNWSSHSNYYTYNNQPFASTFSGGTDTFGSDTPNDGWNTNFIQPLADAGIDVYFMPNFDNANNYPTDFFSTFTVANGAFGWESAWPEITDGLVNVTDKLDSGLIQQAHDASTTYMMPLSTMQFKHLDADENWVRIGESNLPIRMDQILRDQPDFVEIITWNDAGESHYVGTFFQEQIAGSSIADYAVYDHQAWQQVLKPFITAFKNGATSVSSILPNSTTPQGAMWYRPLMLEAACGDDTLGKPDGWQNGQDAINFAILLPSDTSGATINVYTDASGANTKLASFSGVAGLNNATVDGMTTGSQVVEVVDSTGTVIARASSTVDVASDTTGVCNFNYNVVSFASVTGGTDDEEVDEDAGNGEVDEDVCVNGTSTG